MEAPYFSAGRMSLKATKILSDNVDEEYTNKNKIEKLLSKLEEFVSENSDKDWNDLDNINDLLYLKKIYI